MSEYGDAFAAAVAAELRAERAKLTDRPTFDQLTGMTGLSKSALLHYFNGKRDIPLPALMEICRALGVSPVTVIDNAEKALKQG